MAQLKKKKKKTANEWNQRGQYNNWFQLIPPTFIQFTLESQISNCLLYISTSFLIRVDLKCSVNFCCTAKWYMYIYTHTHSFFHIIFHHVPSQVIGYSFLCYIYSRISLLIHAKCNSLYLLTPYISILLFSNNLKIKLIIFPSPPTQSSILSHLPTINSYLARPQNRNLTLTFLHLLFHI